MFRNSFRKKCITLYHPNVYAKTKGCEMVDPVGFFWYIIETYNSIPINDSRSKLLDTLGDLRLFIEQQRD